MKTAFANGLRGKKKDIGMGNAFARPPPNRCVVKSRTSMGTTLRCDKKVQIIIKGWRAVSG